MTPNLTAQFEDAAFTDIPPYHPHPWQRNEGLAGGFQPTDQQIRTRYIGYYTAVTEIDREVGRLLDRLEQDGTLDNTVVIYTSDHGCSVGQNGFWGKGNSTRPTEHVRDLNPRPPDGPRPGPGATRPGQPALRRSLRHLQHHL